MNHKREAEIADALMGPPREEQADMGMKPMAPNNMEIAVDMIHVLSGELKQKNNMTDRVLKDVEAMRHRVYVGHQVMDYVGAVLEGVATPEGQEILRKFHGLKAKDKKKLEAAKQQALVQLREYLLRANI